MIAVCYPPDGPPVPHADAPRPAVVLSGSFNPLHDGHRALAAAAAMRVGGPVHFELSVANVDKPELPADEVARRVRQFAGVAPVWVTRAATFAEKADLFPGAAFAVGWDTAARLIDPRYYGGDLGRRDAALRALAARGCRVVVGGRVDAAGRFRTWDEVGIDAAFLPLFTVLPEADFRLDVSSTALRRAAGVSGGRAASDNTGTDERRPSARPEAPMPTPTLADLAKMFDHSLLQPQLTDAELEAGVLLARSLDVASVCIKPYAVKLAVKLLAGSTVQASTTIGFPHGGHVTKVKVFESELAMDDGATELDMVVNIGKVLSGEWNAVASDVAAVVSCAHAHGAKVKVIFENALLTDAHKRELCRVCGDVRADWVKTSTGYAESGATLPDLRLMREHSPAWVQVKAAGGVRTFDTLMQVREVGVTRVGATATKAILDDARAKLGL